MLVATVVVSRTYSCALLCVCDDIYRCLLLLRLCLLVREVMMVIMVVVVSMNNALGQVLLQWLVCDVCLLSSPIMLGLCIVARLVRVKGAREKPSRRCGGNKVGDEMAPLAANDTIPAIAKGSAKGPLLQFHHQPWT